jgi:hypothetical protein
MPMKTKVIDIKTKKEIFPDKVSIQELRKIWNDKEREYTEEELERIRNWLYSMAEIITMVTERVKQNYKLIQTTNEHENTQSHSLCKSEHRRAS